MSRRLQGGLSVVEILVGLVLGLLLVAGMGSMVVGSRQTTRVERQLLEMQVTGRVALDVLSREIRKAGYRPTRDRSIQDVFPAAGSPFVAAGAVVAGAAAGDAVTVRFQGLGDTWTSDCLGNTVNLGQDIWETILWQDGQLQCRVRNLALATDRTLALIPQIEAFQVSYGVDTDGDGFADAYQAAPAVTDWARVASVNVRLRVVSSEDGLADRPQPYVDTNGTTVTPTDRRIRRSFSTVVALRNLLP